MKKQTKRLTLNKKTISNLIPSEMNRVIGGASYLSHLGCSRCGGHCGGGGGTINGNTCAGHNTCQYTCV